jgi:hypothetical protein
VHLQFRGCPLKDEVTTLLTSPGAEIDNVIGRDDRVVVMLDNNNGIVEIAKLPQRLQKPVVVPLVKPDAGFIENIEYPREARTYLGGKTDPLRFAGGQGG